MYHCLKGKSGTVKGLCNKSLSFSKKSIETLKIEPFSKEKSKSTHACFKEKRYTDFTRFVGTGKSEFLEKQTNPFIKSRMGRLLIYLMFSPTSWPMPWPERPPYLRKCGNVILTS